MRQTRTNRRTRARTDRLVLEWKGHNTQLLTAKVFVQKLPEPSRAPMGWRIQEVYDQLAMRGDWVAARIWEKTHPGFSFESPPAYLA